jgi:hypothetical protein
MSKSIKLHGSAGGVGISTGGVGVGISAGLLLLLCKNSNAFSSFAFGQHHSLNL